MPDDCKIKRELGHVATGEDLVTILEEAKALTKRCGCKAVAIVLKPKDGFKSLTVGCLRGGGRKKELGA